MTRYWEDFAVGDVFELGEYRLERDELLAFARRYDPQPFHVDDAAAAAGPFGGLAASGWHTAAIWMRLYALSLLADCVSLGSPGIRELRWLAPVRPGTLLRARVTVDGAEPSSRHPDRGTLFMRGELLEPDARVVLTLVARGLFGRRPPADLG